MQHTLFRNYLSLILLFVPPLLFGLGLWIWRAHPRSPLVPEWPFLPWQFYLMGIAGIVATIGGVLDWRYHRDPLQLKLSAREREAEAKALGLGGVPMFVLMFAAMLSARPNTWLVPIVVVLVYTVVAICYDEFVFHLKRCGPLENAYHRMLVFGNGVAWLAWFGYIFG